MPDVQFGRLINVKTESLIYLKALNAEFLFIEIWFTNQYNEPLQMKDNANITLVVSKKKKIFIKITYHTDNKYVQSYDFLSLAKNFENKYCKKIMTAAKKLTKANVVKH